MRWPSSRELLLGILSSLLASILYDSGRAHGSMALQSGAFLLGAVGMGLLGWWVYLALRGPYVVRRRKLKWTFPRGSRGRWHLVWDESVRLHVRKEVSQLRFGRGSDVDFAEPDAPILVVDGESKTPVAFVREEATSMKRRRYYSFEFPFARGREYEVVFPTFDLGEAMDPDKDFVEWESITSVDDLEVTVVFPEDADQFAIEAVVTSRGNAKLRDLPKIARGNAVSFSTPLHPSQKVIMRYVRKARARSLAAVAG